MFSGSTHLPKFNYGRKRVGGEQVHSCVCFTLDHLWLICKFLASTSHRRGTFCLFIAHIFQFSIWIMSYGHPSPGHPSSAVPLLTDGISPGSLPDKWGQMEECHRHRRSPQLLLSSALCGVIYIWHQLTGLMNFSCGPLQRRIFRGL